MNTDPSDEELRVQVAEALGYKGPRHPDTLAKLDTWISRDWGHWYLDPTGKPVSNSYVPDWPGDIQAMHEAEETLSHNEREGFARCLWDACTGGSYGLERGCVYEDDLFKVLHATARQRCLAFLRVVSGRKGQV